MTERSRVRILVGSAEEFSSLGPASYADSYVGISCTSVLLQSHLKYSGRSAKSAGGRLQLNHMHPTYVALNEVAL